MIQFQDICNHEDIHTFIAHGDHVMKALGYTEHSFPHASITADRASKILAQLGYTDREQELAKIAGYLHDIGNLINRVDHAHSGGIMAFQILSQMGMSALEIAQIISAIGSHDEATAVPVNPISAALILADKSDVRRTRVRNRNTTAFDIHDRVNYAVEHSTLLIDEAKTEITLNVTIDPQICLPMEYFEIFIGRMLLCRRAAEYLKLRFGLVINTMRML